MELERQKNVATIISFPLVDVNGAIVTGAAGLDSQWDGFADGTIPNGFTACTNEATEVGSDGVYYLSLTQTEMNNDYVIIQVKSNALTQFILIRTIVGDPLNKSVHAPADIWSVGTKVITGGVLTTPADYKADVTNLDAAITTRAPANEYDTELDANISTRAVPNEYDTVISALQADLDDPNQYKADVSAIVITGGVLTTPADYMANVTGLAPSNEYDADFVTVKVDLDNPAQYMADVSLLALETSVQDIKALTDNLPADTELELIKLKGLGGIWLVAEYHHDVDNDNDYIQFWQYGTQADFDNETKVNAVNKWRQDITYTSNLPVKSKWNKVA